MRSYLFKERAFPDHCRPQIQVHTKSPLSSFHTPTQLYLIIEFFEDTDHLPPYYSPLLTRDHRFPIEFNSVTASRSP